MRIRPVCKIIFLLMFYVLFCITCTSTYVSITSTLKHIQKIEICYKYLQYLQLAKVEVSTCSPCCLVQWSRNSQLVGITSFSGKFKLNYENFSCCCGRTNVVFHALLGSCSHTSTSQYSYIFIPGLSKYRTALLLPTKSVFIVVKQVMLCLSIVIIQTRRAIVRKFKAIMK